MLVPKNLKKHYQILVDEGIDIEGLYGNFESSLLGKMLRLYVAPMLRFMPTRLRYLITDIPKRLRNPSRKPKLHYPLDLEENQLLAHKLKSSNEKPWWDKKAVLCLSHDVDNDEGYRFVRKMAEMDLEAGIESTFNFLTHDNYTLEDDILLYLKEKKMEIGLHGHTHDQGFALRSKSRMHKKLKAALGRLKDYNITGTRTPALSKSERLFEVLQEASIKYDSSLQVGSGIYYSVRIPYPFYFHKHDVWEIPLMIQDDNYIRDAVVTDAEMIDSIKRFMDETILINGVMVLNMHPHLMWNRVDLYKNILDMIQGYSKDVAFKSTQSVHEYIANTIVEI